MKYSKRDCRTFFVPLLSVTIFTAANALSQTSNVPYVSPTAAASGMTSGLENGATQGTIDMMQVRASAQQAERAAAAAAMARSAEAAIEEEGLKSALARARETRRQKMEAAERLKWQRATAYNAYNKVSAGEMQTWKDASGNVKVGRGIPSDFALAITEEEARAAAAAPKKRGGPLKLGKKLTDKAMRGLGVEEPMQDSGLSGPKPLPPAAAPRSQGRSLTLNPPKIKAPKFSIPKFGKKRSQADTPPETPQFANASSGPPPAPAATAAAAKPADTPEPASSGSQAAARPTSTASSTAASIPARSAADLLKKDPDAPKPADSASSTTPSNLPPTTKKTGGLFARNSSQPKPASAPSSPRKFNFGKKKTQTAPAPNIDTGLFPAGTMTSTPQGGQLSGGYTAATSAAPPTPTPSAPSSVNLPGAGSEPEKKKFALPKPKLSVPKIATKSSSGSVSPSSTVNRNGNSYYIVEATSQFMKYGASRSETTITAVQPGMTVLMTKPGADWATVRLNDGSSGVIQTKNLRAASGSEVPASFAPATANYANMMQKQINGN